MTEQQRQEQRLIKAGAIKVNPQGCGAAWQIGSRLIWVGLGKQVLVGYAHSPQQQGVRMSLGAALKLCN